MWSERNLLKFLKNRLPPLEGKGVSRCGKKGYGNSWKIEQYRSCEETNKNKEKSEGISLAQLDCSGLLF
jgi:hypothetical protein